MELEILVTEKLGYVNVKMDNGEEKNVKNMVSFIDISILPFYKFYFMKLTQLCLLLLTKALFLFKKEAFAIFIVQMKTRKISFTFRVFWFSPQRHNKDDNKGQGYSF